MKTLLERCNKIILVELEELSSVQPVIVSRIITNLDSMHNYKNLEYQDIDVILNFPRVREMAILEGFKSDSRYRKSFIKLLFNEHKEQTKGQL